MATLADLEQEFYATQLGLDMPWPSIVDLRYLFYLGVKNGDIVLGGDVSPEEVQDSVDAYLTANPVAATTDASALISGTLDAARLPATVATDDEVTTAMNSRAPVSHTHTAASITDLPEAVQDIIGVAFSGGNVTATYDDVTGTISLAAPTGDAGATDPELVRDAIGAALIGVGNITVTINDAADTITISTTATVNSTDAQLRDRSTHTGEQAQSTITGLTAALALLAPKASPTFTGTVSGISKSMVGLGSVDNTSDVNKPVSTAQRAAIDERLRVIPYATDTPMTAGYWVRTSATTIHEVLITHTPTVAFDANPTYWRLVSGSAAATVDTSTLAAKNVTAAYRFRIDASTWEPRPTGYKTVISVGADPSPNDQQPNDLREIPQ